MDIVDKLFEKMEKQDQMDYELFDLNGINYCPVDGTISLKEFIDSDNNINFYSLVKKINIFKKIIKDHGQRIAVQFQIQFQKPHTTTKGPSLELIWILQVSDQQKITVIDSYWNAAEFKKNLENNHPDFLKVFFKV